MGKEEICLEFPEQIQKEAFSLTCRIAVKEQGDLKAVWLSGRIRPAQPLFGPQIYLDPHEGVSFTMGVRGVEKLLAIYQHKDWWLRPAFPARTAQIPARTQLVLMKGGGRYLALLAVCGREYRTDLEGAGEGIRVTASSNCAGKNEIDDVSLVCAFGNDPYECCHNAAAYALALLGRPSMLRERRRYPPMLEKLGWCSWDAFYQKVSRQGILEKLEELKKKRVPVGWVLIDDGWLDADYEIQTLKGLDAAADKFPEGLSECVRRMKEEYGIAHVGVWHAVMGYWNGMEPESEAGRLLSGGTCVLPDGRNIPAAEEGKAFRFYDTWHRYLRNECGIDFVKVDGQSAISLFYEGRKEYGKASAAVQTGLNASAALHFDNNIINCMGMAPEDMWNRPSSAIARSSDDFVPQVPHGFWEHALQNGYNSLLQGQFYWGDWDMFWSSHAENRQNAVLRAVSGGPVYISDPVGETDPEVILPLIRRDGTVIRCDGVGMPTLDCLFENAASGGKALKLFNRYGENYVVAAFSMGEEKSVRAGIRLSDLPGTGGGRWIVYDQRKQEAAFLAEDEEFAFELGENDAGLFLLMPAKDFIPVGILEKLICPGGILFYREFLTRKILSLDEGERAGFLSAKRPERVLIDGREAAFEEKPCAGATGEADFYTVSLGDAGREGCLMEVLFSEG